MTSKHKILVRYTEPQTGLRQVFETTPERLEELPGLAAYFGGINGKHSEVYGRIKTGDLEVLAVSDDEITTVKKVLGGLPADVDLEEAIEHAAEGFGFNDLDTEYYGISDDGLGVVLPGEPGYKERRSKSKTAADAKRCPECHKLPSESGGGTYSHERRCSNSNNRSPR